MAVQANNQGIVIAKLTKDIEHLLTGRTRNTLTDKEAKQEDGKRNAQLKHQLKNTKDTIIGRSGKTYSRKALDKFVSQKKAQVMFKISSYRKTRGDLKNHLNYVTRNGKVSLEDQNGNKITGKTERDEVAEQWHDLELAKEKKRSQYLGREIDERTYPRVAAAIVISMPPGTDREKFAEATREYCREQFADKGYEYMLAFHNDTEHPHAHMLLRLRNIETNRKLNPKREHLKEWRETLQQKMEEHGLDSVATPRRLQGKMPSESRKGVHMDWKELASAMIAQGMKPKDVETLLKGKAKSKLKEPMNRQQMLTRRQKNLQKSVEQALANPRAMEAIKAFKEARKEERQNLLQAISNVASDIAPGYPEEAAKLIDYARSLPKSEPQVMKIVNSVQRQINQDNVR